MPVRITVKNTKISEDTKAHLEDVFTKLRQYYDRIIDCEVILEKGSRHGHVVEMKVQVPQHALVARATIEDDNLFKAIDEARDRMEAQIKKHHDKLVEHR